MIAPLLLDNEERQSLAQILGLSEDALILNEADFVLQTECPRETLEIWLKTFWVQHDIRAVLAGIQKVVRQPWLLRSERDGTVRLFSPSDRLALAEAAEEIALSAQYEVPGQEPLSASDVLSWWDHVEKARKLCIDACRAWRAYACHEATAAQRVLLQIGGGDLVR
jgi:hypothetical protein